MWVRVPVVEVAVVGVGVGDRFVGVLVGVRSGGRPQPLDGPGPALVAHRT